MGIETKLQQAVSSYIKQQYPGVIFMSEASGIRVPIGQAMQLKSMRSGRAIPDMFLAKANSKHHGLFIELKSENIFRRDGEMKKKKESIMKKIGGQMVKIGEKDHLLEQAEIHRRLREEGYWCDFACGFTQCKEIIDNYLMDRI